MPAFPFAIKAHASPAASIRAALAVVWICLWSAAGITDARSQGSDSPSLEAQQTLDRDISRMSDCYRPVNHGCVADLLDPEFVERAGGRDKLVQTMTSVMNEMPQHGLDVRPEQMQFDKPGAITPFGSVLIAKITTSVPAIVRGQAGTIVGTTLALSRDGGKSWRFIEATKATRPALEERFSGLWERLAIPDTRLVPQ